MNSIQPKIIVSTLMLIAGLACDQNAFAVTMSTEEFKEYAREDAYWVVSVNCENGSESRIIQRKTDGDQWCSKDIEGYCYDTKVEAAGKVCGNQFSTAYNQILERQQREQALADREQEEQLKAKQTLDNRKQLNIESELLEIERQKLQLRKDELALQKRTSEIQAELKSLAD